MRLVFAAVLTLPLAACGPAKTPTVEATNATPAEVQAKVAAATGDADLVKPGRWEGSMTMHDMQMSGLPPEVQQQMSARMTEPHRFTSCVTPEDVKAKRGFFTGAKDSHCTYDHFTMAGGKIDAAMVCKETVGTMKATMAGSYTPESYHFDMRSTTEAPGAGAAPGGPGAQKMTITIDARRTGECRGDENGATPKTKP
ncbi:DUF3617 domain-containing protein [Sphingomonas sp. NFR15]|uniref:DUF3617 domain-containing protein n=1 Tax=Sphingomonas sp. NFR15 TaxID=1566282 RepID=UPI0008851448|nr:DUF3617 domain-containing protein [Sphingomonas sp. NFR15]SDA17366.1 Protein of unknown function [Sphingomonas sp. NFR15]